MDAKAVEWNLRRAATILGKDDAGLDALARDVAAGKTAPVRPDRRFPNTNQAANCWTALNEYQLCVEKRGRTDASCLQRGRDYGSLCPQKWCVSCATARLLGAAGADTRGLRAGAAALVRAP